MTHHFQKIITEKLSNINNITSSKFDTFLLTETILLLEAYNIGRNLTSDSTVTIDDRIIKFDNFLNKNGGKNYILVDFYSVNEDNTKDYSTLPKKQTTKEYLERESKILSSAYDSAILFLINKHNQFFHMGKEVPISGISFYPKRSENDNNRLTADSENAQRTTLYKRFIQQLFGASSFDLTSDGGNIYMTFKTIQPIIGSEQFKEQLKEIPYGEEIGAVYGIKVL